MSKITNSGRINLPAGGIFGTQQVPHQDVAGLLWGVLDGQTLQVEPQVIDGDSK